MTSNHSAFFRARSQRVAIATLLALPVWGCAKAEPHATTPHSAGEGTTPAVSAAPIQGGAASGGASPGETDAVPSEQSYTAVATSMHAVGGGSPPAGSLGGPPEPEPVDGLAALTQTSQPGVKITGCLAEPAQENTATRSAPTRTANAPTWRVSSLGNTVVVTHTLDHACCLQGTATATVNGAVIVVEEQLTGQPCRCMCSSTIQTRVSAPPGDYEVQTFTVTNGTKQLAKSGRVTVAGALRPSKR